MGPALSSCSPLKPLLAPLPCRLAERGIFGPEGRRVRLSEAEFRRREQAAIAAFLPGDTHSRLQVDTHFSKVNSDLILVPIYLRSYRYKGKLYRALINGQTGKIAGQKPLSPTRIAGAIVILILLLFLIYLIGSGALR